MFVLNIEDKSRLHIYLLSATLGLEKNTWVSNFPVFLEKCKSKVYGSVAPPLVSVWLESHMVTSH